MYITFNEKAFVEFMIDRFYNDESDESCEILFDKYFKLSFPTDEICEVIHSLYYSTDPNSLYSILLTKVQDVLLEEEDEEDEIDAYKLWEIA